MARVATRLAYRNDGARRYAAQARRLFSGSRPRMAFWLLPRTRRAPSPAIHPSLRARTSAASRRRVPRAALLDQPRTFVHQPQRARSFSSDGGVSGQERGVQAGPIGPSANRAPSPCGSRASSGRFDRRRRHRKAALLHRLVTLIRADAPVPACRIHSPRIVYFFLLRLFRPIHPNPTTPRSFPWISAPHRQLPTTSLRCPLTRARR